jgi:hypothetical protein
MTRTTFSVRVTASAKMVICTFMPSGGNNREDTPKSLTRCNVEIIDCVHFSFFCIDNDRLQITWLFAEDMRHGLAELGVSECQSTD